MQAQLEKNKAIVTRFNREVIENGDLQAFDEIVSPAFLNHSAPAGADNGANGARYFLINVLRKAIPDLKVEIYDMTAEGDRVVTRKAIKGTQKEELLGAGASGQPVTLNIIDIIRLEDGKYVEHWSLREMSPGV
jgi:predicted ester cyclase